MSHSVPVELYANACCTLCAGQSLSSLMRLSRRSKRFICPTHYSRPRPCSNTLVSKIATDTGLLQDALSTLNMSIRQAHLATDDEMALCQNGHQVR